MNELWKERVAYQIYPRSFNDSNNDGIGDIPGIIEKLDYLKDLGVGIIWLSPVYKSPQKDNGYDVSDYLDIDPLFGTLEDMDNLIKAAEKRDIKIIMDLVLNHTSDQHIWFQKSREGIEPYKDYYIWKDPKNGSYPNNWDSIFTGPAWKYDELRKQYYLHLFAEEQPDLNFHNPKVIEEIKNIMRFWLERGIYGFRCDAVNVIYKSSFKDSVTKSVRKGREYYLSQPGNHLILKELKKDVLDNYDCFTVGEAGHVDKETAHLFCDKKSKELDMIFTFDHLETHEYLVKWFRRKFKPKKFFEKLSFWQKELEWNPIFFENHDQIRSVTDLGNDKLYWQESSKMLATLLLTLKGTPFIYQGEEIGMTNANFKSLAEIEDIESLNGFKMLRKWGLPKFLAEKFILKSSRDNCRTPFQWNDDKYAGFSTTKPPLKLCDNYQRINAESQIEAKTSILNFYKQLIGLRKTEETLVKGDFTELLITNHLFAYERQYQDKSLIIIVNSSKKKQRISIKGELVLSNYKRTDFNGNLSPYEAVILRK